MAMECIPQPHQSRLYSDDMSFLVAILCALGRGCESSRIDLIVLALASKLLGFITVQILTSYSKLYKQI